MKVNLSDGVNLMSAANIREILLIKGTGGSVQLNETHFMLTWPKGLLLLALHTRGWSIHATFIAISLPLYS